MTDPIAEQSIRELSEELETARKDHRSLVEQGAHYKREYEAALARAEAAGVTVPELLQLLLEFDRAEPTREPEAEPGTWRVGSRVPRNLYENDRDVGRMDTPELAARVVAAMNREVAVPEGEAEKCEPCSCEEAEGLKARVARALAVFDGAHSQCPSMQEMARELRGQV